MTATSLELGAPDLAAPFGLATRIASAALCGAALWAALAPLDSAAMAPGFVQVETNRKVVQHQEGGIIREIFVREGQRVRAGQALIQLTDVQTGAQLGSLRAQRDAALAEEARLVAERDGLAEPHFPAELTQRAAVPSVAELMAAQRRLLASRRGGFSGKQAMTRQKVAQLEAQISATQAQLATLDVQLALVREEAAAAEAMLAKGYERKPRVLAIQRTRAALEGEQAALRGRIASAREAIAEARLQGATLSDDERATVVAQLQAIQERLALIRERLSPAADQQSRRLIAAPVDGRVFNLRVTTKGAVLAPGAEVLDIVPAGDRLIIDARLAPNDIDVVHQGMTARVRLTAYRQRVTPTLEGTVTRVSADALIDPVTARPYYAVKVALDPRELARTRSVALVPGMPAEVMIRTGSRTTLDYLLGPISDGMAHAMREE